MRQQHSVFEVSFEVCNKVGGIYTVLSTKAPTLVKRYGDEYVCVGPWLLRDDEQHPVPFEKEAGFENFEESCRAAGLPVQVGRWTIPGRPRTVLIEFSSLYEKKDDLLAQLWERFKVDSMKGDWDYVEPVLFGHAAGEVIQRWWEEYLAPSRRRSVAQFHEWMTGAGALHLERTAPGIGTVFTTHATMLGRALSSLGRSPADGLGEDSPEELAEEHGVTAKHSLEGVCARHADVFTTVSEITAAEAELLHERRPDPVLPNGIDLEAIDAMAGAVERAEARDRLQSIAATFLGEDISDAVLIATSGRYEFHNKGIDLLLDAAADLQGREGRRAVVFVLVPAANSGLRAGLREREGMALDELDGPVGISTHNLFDEANDPVVQRCIDLGLTNQPGSRIKVVQVPIYLSEHDDFLQLPYEAVVRALDLTCFPSYYEPWGYTPQESLALAVPTVTTDHAGFGRWAESRDLGPADGVTVLKRERRTYAEARSDLGSVLESFLREYPPPEELAAACRAAAGHTAWSDLIVNYEVAFEHALAAVQERLERGVPLRRRVKKPVAVEGESRAPRLKRFDVSATLPPELEPLATLAQNYDWCWDPEARALFEELSPTSWAAAGHNPVLFLRHVFLQDLEQRAKDPEFVGRLQRAVERLDRADPVAPDGTLGLDGSPVSLERPVAYFCAEFGIHESLRIYSGGLGILAGDHLKSASDLGLPLLGIGLFYRHGYMSQRLTAEGAQVEVDLENDPRDLPMTPVVGPDGQLLEIRLRLPSRELFLRAWKVKVGGVPLYLLDADVPANRPEDREITHRLYGGDDATRIRQEIVLGRGGARLLARLGIEPSVWHMNEGHAAFLSLERMAHLVRHEGLTFEEAREVVRATTAFTTHTPVPAGHDRFSEDLMRTYFSDVADWLGVPWERFFALGGSRDELDEGVFNMTRLGLHFASWVNGVSRMHGEVSRELLRNSWPGLLESEVPVESITNGVHLPTWVRPSMARLVTGDARPVRGEDFAERAAEIAPEHLWSARREAKGALLEVLQDNLKRSFVERYDSPALLNRMLDGIRGDALWIGFARRFAPYKRAHIIFDDPDRLRALLDDEERPVRLLVAGKAHPRDGLGKEILADVARIARSDEFAGRVFLAEDYGIELARALVQGVDVWLNTPTRRLEASGTSGMKAAANGVLNLSVADGWWPEGADGRNGWTIGDGRTYEDQEFQDQLDSETLYRLLEEEVVPLYYERAGTLPEAWIERSRNALATLPAIFDTDRMVREYANRAYAPLAREGARLAAHRSAAARLRARDKARLQKSFSDIRVTDVRVADLSDAHVGDFVEVRVELELGALTPDDVCVELVLGHVRGDDDLIGAVAVPLRRTGEGEGPIAYEGEHRIDRSGAYAYGVRVRPADEFGDSADVLRDLVRWVG